MSLKKYLSIDDIVCCRRGTEILSKIQKHEGDVFIL